MADPVWLYRNAVSAWRHRGSLRDFVRRLRFVYAQKPSGKDKGWKDWTIGFRYPAPVGSVQLVLRANDGADNFIHSEVFEHQYYDFPLVSSPKTILDLGANIGLTAVYFSRRYPQARIACVEPVPENLGLLRRNIALNGVSADTIPAAIDKEDGLVRMALHRFDYGHSIAAKGAEAPTIGVTAISMPTLLQQLGWQRVGLLKMDIEGHEKILFSGNCDWLSRVDAMCIEWHFDDGERALGELAQKFGFDAPVFLTGVWLMQRPESGHGIV